MNIYIAKPFYGESGLQKSIRELKEHFSVWECHKWKDIALPDTRELLDAVDQQESLLFSYFLEDADVLIFERGLVQYDVRNPNTPFFSDLAQHRVLLIICSEANGKAVSPDKLNIGIDRNKLFLLEYEKNMIELQSYILNAISIHSVFLQTTKPLLIK